MGQDITKDICHKYGIAYNHDFTKTALRKNSVILPFSWHVPTREDLIKICKEEGPKTFDDLVIRRLSIAGRKIWEERTKIDFNQFFESHLDLLSQYIKIEKADILNF